MKMEAKIVDKCAESITDTMGINVDDLASFSINVVRNESNDLTIAVMEELEKMGDKAGSISVALVCMKMKDDFQKVEGCLGGIMSDLFGEKC